MLRGAVLLLALAVVVNMTPLHKQQWWMESKGADVATSTLRKLKPVLPDEFGDYLPV
jgi:membrane protein required for colicin V production